MVTLINQDLFVERVSTLLVGFLISGAGALHLYDSGLRLRFVEGKK